MKSFAEQIAHAVGDTRKLMADIGGANTPEMKANARILAREIRKTLSKKGAPILGPLRPGAKQRFTPSAPGEAPHRQTGKAAKSIGTQVVDGVMRVGTGRFTLRILQDGTTGAAKGAAVDKAGKRRHKRRSLKRPSVTIAPRPFMEKALAAALPKMEGDMVGQLQKRTRQT